MYARLHPRTPAPTHACTHARLHPLPPPRAAFAAAVPRGFPRGPLSLPPRFLREGSSPSLRGRAHSRPAPFPSKSKIAAARISFRPPFLPPSCSPLPNRGGAGGGATWSPSILSTLQRYGLSRICGIAKKQFGALRRISECFSEHFSENHPFFGKITEGNDNKYKKTQPLPPIIHITDKSNGHPLENRSQLSVFHGFSYIHLSFACCFSFLRNFSYI